MIELINILNFLTNIKVVNLLIKRQMQKMLQRVCGLVQQEELLIYIEKIQVFIKPKSEYRDYYVEFIRHNHIDRTEHLSLNHYTSGGTASLSFSKVFIKLSQFYREKSVGYPNYQTKKIVLRLVGFNH